MGTAPSATVDPGNYDQRSTPQVPIQPRNSGDDCVTVPGAVYQSETVIFKLKKNTFLTFLVLLHSEPPRLGQAGRVFQRWSDGPRPLHNSGIASSMLAQRSFTRRQRRYSWRR